MRNLPRPSMGLTASAVLLLVALAAPAAMAQTASTAAPAPADPQPTGVRLFHDWVSDAVFTPGIDFEPIADYEMYGGFNRWFAGARMAFWVADGVEAGGRIGWSGVDPDNSDGDTSFADLDLYGRFRIPAEFDGTLAAGGQLTLPTGDRTAGQDNTIVRIFGAVRKELNGSFTFAANLGFEYLDYAVGRGNDSVNGLTLGLGSLVPMTDALTLVGEFDLRTSYEYAMLTGGLDFQLPPGGHLRGAVGIGLDDEAPDVEFQASLSLPVF